MNLIYALEKEGILPPALTDRIFEKSLEQANSFLLTLDQVDDASAKLDSEDMGTGLDRAAIESAIEMLGENYREIKDKRQMTLSALFISFGSLSEHADRFLFKDGHC